MSRGLRRERRALYGGEAWAMSRVRKAIAASPPMQSAVKTNRVFTSLQSFLTKPAKLLGRAVSCLRGAFGRRGDK